MLEFDQYKIELAGLTEPISELYDAMGIERAKAEKAELEKQTEAPDFYGNMENSQKVLQRIKRLSVKIDKYFELKNNLEETQTLLELAMAENEEELADEIGESVKTIKASIDEMTLEALLRGQYDKNNAILTLHAGAGGTEAQDWTEMLLRMYQRFAERRGYSVTVIDMLDGDEAGIKSASILIEGENAYGYLKCEKGVHRLVRISPFDASGRRHTSFASLEVMPDIENDSGDTEINPADLRVDTFRSSGAGGQHVNKTSSAIRITHIPTGIVVSCQNERSQHQNRDFAMKMLKAKLAEIAEREHKEKIQDIKGAQKEIAWGSQIRSYVFCPYTMAKDHRTNFEITNINSVMDGNIYDFINAYLKAANAGTLEK